jgi:hypothetical protein
MNHISNSKSTEIPSTPVPIHIPGDAAAEQPELLKENAVQPTPASVSQEQQPLCPAIAHESPVSEQILPAELPIVVRGLRLRGLKEVG